MQLATASTKAIKQPSVAKQSETIASERAPKPPSPKQKSKSSDMDTFNKLERYEKD